MNSREKIISAIEKAKKQSEEYAQDRIIVPFKEADMIIALLKEQEAVEPYMDYDGHDVWRCGNCGATIFHIEQSQADEDWKNYAKFCRQCGKKVKWE